MAEALRKLNRDGVLYSRPPEIENCIDILSALPSEEMVRRVPIYDRGDPDYIPSECLVYFLRRLRSDNSDKLFQVLFIHLRLRVVRALPAIERYVLGGQTRAVSASLSDLRDTVLYRFNEMLCRDRGEYDGRLDFFEIRFDSAVAKLRHTAFRSLVRAKNREEPLIGGDVTDNVCKDAQEAHDRQGNPLSMEIEDSDYRSYLLTAIDSLPDDQRRVVTMLLQDIPIDSKDETTITIVKTLGCSEKTVRNRRDRAYDALRKALDKETIT